MINNCKVDKKGRIMELGLCSDNCRDEHTEKPLQFTNVNLLTKKECQYFLNTSVSWQTDIKATNSFKTKYYEFLFLYI